MMSSDLTQTGLVEWIVDVAPQPLQQFERCDSDLRFEGIYLARNEESNAHKSVSVMLNGAPSFGRPARHGLVQLRLMRQRATRIQTIFARAARILLALNVVISDDAIYYTLVDQDIDTVEQP